MHQCFVGLRCRIEWTANRSFDEADHLESAILYVVNTELKQAKQLIWSNNITADGCL